MNTIINPKTKPPKSSRSPSSKQSQSRSHRRTQWLWFITLWSTSLLITLIISYTLKFIIKSI